MSSTSSNLQSSSPSTSWDEGDLIKHELEDGRLLLVSCDDAQKIENVGSRFWKMPDADFWRKNISPFRLEEGELNHTYSYDPYIRWEKSDLDAEFGKYQLRDDDEKKLRALLESMREGKVKPRNVVCIALGSLHNGRASSRERSFAQLAALLKFIQLLDIPQNGQKIVQDPALSPGDARFLDRFGFQVVTDPEAINAIDGETLLFYVRGYDMITERIMDRPRPAMFINDRSLEVQLNRDEDARSAGQKDRATIAMRRLFHSEKVPRIGEGDGMMEVSLYWRRATVKCKAQRFVDAAVEVVSSICYKKQ
ncbi:hypothetical protein EYC80_001795 [Monilinia laxa]|uniref:SRR1-like domain-containing protein n=1 Tax=Monilinia laxa TaxID=61186 RepID=A0A5N6K627_MONLA|nr:hypothetical protein EYC80_001795 [Monilinia laxa]